MRRFELIEGKSSKFWEVEIQGVTLSGRIGTNGQTQTREFADAAAAEKAEGVVVAPPATAPVIIPAGAAEAVPLAASNWPSGGLLLRYEKDIPGSSDASGIVVLPVVRGFRTTG